MDRPRRREVALGLQQAGEVVEALRRVRMLGAKHLLPDRQRALKERPRLNVGGKRVKPVLSKLSRSAVRCSTPFGAVASSPTRASA